MRRVFTSSNSSSPMTNDYFVLKPMQSAFYQRLLDVLLRHLGASSLIFADLTTNSCILCWAHDANMRDYKIVGAANCCAARSQREHRPVVGHIRAVDDAKVCPRSPFSLDGLLGKADRERLREAG